MDSLVKINIGAAPNDGTGDPARDAFAKHNKNMDSIANALGAASGIATLGADGRLPPGQAPAVQTLPATAHDLNNYQLPGSYRQASTAGAQAGTNYPQATGGILVVEGTGVAGQTVQRYTVASTGPVSPTAGTRQYWRFAINTSWSPWQEVLTAGNALPYLGRVETGADLNNYANRGMWAIAASSTAAGGTNFPIANSGWLLVFCEASAGAAVGTNVNQVYIGSNGNRQFFRSLVGGVWSAWEEVVRSSLLGALNGVATLDGNGRLVQPHAFSSVLTAGTDANVAVFPGFYYLNSDAQATAALNWPVLLAGTLQVEAAGAGNLQITQTYTTRNGTGGVIRRFVRVRFGTAGTWGSWQEIPVLDAATGRLPANRLPPVTEALWDGTTLNLMPGGRFILGNFDGVHASTTTSFRQGQASTSVTYVPIVPPAGGSGSFVICRTAADANSGFLATGVGSGIAEITFSRHGSGAAPTYLRFQSAISEAGRVYQDGSWTLGVHPAAVAAQAQCRVAYAGGGTQWGQLMCPRADGAAAIAFQNSGGTVVGSITTSASATVYNTSSDYRLKTVTGDTDGWAAIARLMQVRVREFTWKADGREDRGVLAHELAETHPSAVSGEKDAMLEMPGFESQIMPQGVDYSKLVPDLIAAIQEQQRQLEAKQGQIDSLTQRLEALEAAAGSAN